MSNGCIRLVILWLPVACSVPTQSSIVMALFLLLLFSLLEKHEAKRSTNTRHNSKTNNCSYNYVAMFTTMLTNKIRDSISDEVHGVRLGLNLASLSDVLLTLKTSSPLKAAETPTSLLPTEVPHKTARIFTSSASTTTFTRLSTDHHFLWPYFYPSFYHGLDSENALSFIPSPSASATKSFAFMNEMEIISSPELFYSRATNSVIAGLSFPIYDHDVLQTVARLNVVGSSVTTMEDSGWSDDFRYIFGTALGQSQRLEGNVPICYSYFVPDCIALHDLSLV
ncbi:Receptor-like protein kinase FERONIA [Nymphaea thermarum]|nr:Receptor-like protein kinase FERONIA [Nymphaea thermarum]